MIFKDNISPRMERFFQWETYYGVLEGVPNVEINKDKIKHLAEATKKYFSLNATYTIIPFENSRNQLPSIICIAELTYHHPMKDMTKECSKVGLIWFQDNYALPIDKEILEKINQLEWKEITEDAYL